MTPDFEYLLRLEPLSVWSHTLPGLLFFCVPVGLAAWIAWEHIARSPARELLALRDERSPYPVTPRILALASLAILIGAASHLAWDAFTHSGRLGAMLIPQLENEAWRIGTYSLRWFSVLQHLSSILGAVVLGLWYLNERRRYGVSWNWTEAGSGLLRIITIGALVGAVNAFVPHTVGDALYPGTLGLMARFAVGGMVGAAVALLVHGAARKASQSV